MFKTVSITVITPDPIPCRTQLRGQRDTIEGLVDEVVQGYHNGFNKAIHNYSQILQLFANCKTHVNTLRTSLQEAKGQLGAQSRNLQQQVKLR